MPELWAATGMDVIAERKVREAALVKENNGYLEDHPEVKQLLNDFISTALVDQPEDVFAFAREYFKGTATNVDDNVVAPEDVAEADDAQDDLDDMLDGESSYSPLKAHLKSVFDDIDTDSSGTITRAELKAKLDKDEELKQLLEAAGGSGDYYVMEQLDEDGDGTITWQEFETMLADVA